MRVKVNDTKQLNIKKGFESTAKNKNIVCCCYVDCIDDDTICCEECILNNEKQIPLNEIICSTYDPQLMQMSASLASIGVLKGAGGPFGSVIVKDGKIVGYGHNTVIQDNDPTAHGEINAIRDACKNLGTFDLTGCELYTSSEPCSMCLSAIIWANIKKVYYGCTVKDAEDIGFRDSHIYEWLETRDSEVLDLQCMDRYKCLEVFEDWKQKQDKVEY